MNRDTLFDIPTRETQYISCFGFPISCYKNAIDLLLLTPTLLFLFFQTSMIKRFCENSGQLLTINFLSSQKASTIEFSQGPEYNSVSTISLFLQNLMIRKFSKTCTLVNAVA